MYSIAPSILSANFVRLEEEIAAVEAGGASILHVDVMDGRFVPNITIGLPVVRSIRKSTSMTIDTHLMIVEPGNYAVQFVDAGADMVSVHIEADPHVHRTLQGIRQAGAKAGVVVNPGTPISALSEAIYHADFVLLMSVNPGFGGQRFIPRSIGRLRELRQMISERGLDVKIEIDGGIDLTNVAEVADAGAEIMVAGSAVFGTDNPAEAVRALSNKGAVWV
ncbi:MAG TPA: ribulose-phosphate 3-epimerase [Blastocatellia bacterium]|nr:ribulose-phosphate 3-epimerase [Blastocatellia bacterium]